jgi:hypothetical protein
MVGMDEISFSVHPFLSLYESMKGLKTPIYQVVGCQILIWWNCGSLKGGTM